MDLEELKRVANIDYLQFDDIESISDVIDYKSITISNTVSTHSVTNNNQPDFVPSTPIMNSWNDVVGLTSGSKTVDKTFSKVQYNINDTSFMSASHSKSILSSCKSQLSQFKEAQDAWTNVYGPDTRMGNWKQVNLLVSMNTIGSPLTHGLLSLCDLYEHENYPGYGLRLENIPVNTSDKHVYQPAQSRKRKRAVDPHKASPQCVTIYETGKINICGMNPEFPVRDCILFLAYILRNTRDQYINVVVIGDGKGPNNDTTTYSPLKYSHLPCLRTRMINIIQ